MRSFGFEKRASGRSLLVVEDDADIRETLDGLLSMEGFHVIGCSNGREALDWLHASPKPDVILLDLMMPVMDGWQFRVVQKQDPELSAIPVVALSADATAKAAAIDADAYLKKPVEYETLLETIDHLLVASEHRELQARLAQTDRLTSLGTLTAGVAHEINNPLAYLLLNLSYVIGELPKLLATPPEEMDDRAREVCLALDHARNGAERIRDVVRSLKTFSRPENETLAPIDVAQVLDGTLAMVANEIRHRARVIKDYAQTPKVVANEARLGQVFLNLLLNAVQALPERPYESNEIRVVLRPSESERVVVEVHDNGAGIPPQVRGRIFEPFFTTKPVGIGTGLGLAICHGIITSLGGTISVESELGKGSVFRVELPSVGRTIGAAAAARASEAGPVSPASHARGRILIVDDEPMVSRSLRQLLSREGRILAVTSAREALAHVESGDRFDIIFCDLLMPQMDGPGLYEALRKIAPDQAERMVFITGGPFTARARAFLERVPNVRVTKPFDVEALFELVRARMA